MMVGVGGGGLGVGPLGRPDALTLALSHRGCCAQPPSFRRKPESRGAGQGEGARDLAVNPSYVRLCTAPTERERGRLFCSSRHDHGSRAHSNRHTPHETRPIQPCNVLSQFRLRKFNLRD